MEILEEVMPSKAILLLGDEYIDSGVAKAGLPVKLKLSHEEQLTRVTKIYATMATELVLGLMERGGDCLIQSSSVRLDAGFTSMTRSI